MKHLMFGVGIGEEHTNTQKVLWWVGTIILSVVNRKQYKARLKARRQCFDTCSIFD